MILTSLQKLSSNVGDLGKIIVATSFEWLPKVQKIAQSGHTGEETQSQIHLFLVVCIALMVEETRNKSK